MEDEIIALREQLDYFVRLSQAQAEQINRYKELQRRSQKLIQSLTTDKKEHQTSWKKTNSTLWTSITFILP